MTLITRYLLKHLLITALFVTISLTLAVWLTQVLRFLELIVEAGAPLGVFIQLLLLTVPKFLEIVLPIAIFSAVLFVYNKMTTDNELIVMKAAGLSSKKLARPALILAGSVAFLSFFMNGWITPLSNAQLQEQRQIVKTEYSTLFLREGVFNSFDKDITVYVREKKSDGWLNGLIIYTGNKEETDDQKQAEAIIIAESGRLFGDKEALQIEVYTGTRQQKDSKTGYVSRLDFDRYTIDITPEKKNPRVRWKKPDERSLSELFNPDLSNPIDAKMRNVFQAEFHKRVAGVFLVIAFTLVALACLFAGTYDRRGQHHKIMIAIGLALIVESLFLAFSNLATKESFFIYTLYATSIIPGIIAWLVLTNRLPAHLFPFMNTSKQSEEKQ